MRVFGKLNLFLNVGEAKGGFHEIESVFSPCFDIYDEVEIETCGGEAGGEAGCDCVVEFAVADFVRSQSAGYVARYQKLVSALAGGEDNTAKAVKLFAGKFGVSAIKVSVSKGVPFSAGMGGSSASAVAVLKCLCEKFGVGYADVADIAGAVGSDLLGMWSGGVNFCSGRGEVASEIAGEVGGYAVVCTPDFGVSTGAVFGKFDEMADVKIFADVQACKAGEFDYFSGFEKLSNSLECASFEVQPRLYDFARVLREKSGVKFQMTGSGSGFFTLVRDLESAEKIHEKVRKYCDFSAISKV